MSKHNRPQRRLLGSVCLFGLVVLLVLFGALLFLSIYGGIPLFSPISLWKGSFAQALEEYDQRVLEDPGLSFRQRNGLLDSLEKKTLDTENTLSVLKRRRALAFHSPDDREQYLSAYIEAAQRAREAYPFSAQVAALSAETLILDTGGRALSEEGMAEMRDLAVMMSQGALQDISLAVSVYSGAMGDPASARFLPRELFTLLCSLTQGEEREKYLVNACIRTVLEGDTQEATVMVNSIFDPGVEVPPLRKDTYRFGGEFFYDHGNYLRAAELFSAFNDDRGLARQGDALWLANFVDSARGLWTVAASSELPADSPAIAGDETAPSAVRARVLYNLASSAADAQEEGRWLERLFAANAEYQNGRIFGIIRYSRLAPLDRALAILQQAGDTEGLFDLEMLRRRSADWTIDKTVAETWLLLNRHPNDGRLYEWAVWYFDFQHRYEETALALRNAGVNRVEGPWSGLHRAFAQARENLLEDAEKTLRSIVRSPGSLPGSEVPAVPGRRQQPLWQASADLGLLLDTAHNPQEALQYYEIAAGMLNLGQLLEENQQSRNDGLPAAGISPERRDAARIQLRIAGVLRSLGKEAESSRALDYALDLDPENLEARLEKRRLDSSRAIL